MESLIVLFLMVYLLLEITIILSHYEDLRHFFQKDFFLELALIKEEFKIKNKAIDIIAVILFLIFLPNIYIKES